MKRIIMAISALISGTLILSGCADKPPRQVLSSDFSRPIGFEESTAENSAIFTSLPSESSTESGAESTTLPIDTPTGNNESSESSATENSRQEADAPVLLYMGQASIRVVTPENKVIYIDPYAGDQYELPADLILVTHGHFDHSMTDKVTNRADGWQIITHNDALQNGEHRTFEMDYVTVEAVEAGYNPLHDVGECVGYVLTFTNGKSIYVTGDTSKTEQMPLLAEKQIDYAFFCCDGVYNMGLEEAAECAELVGAKHNIPYHNTATTTGQKFSRELAEQFNAPNRLIVEDGEEILID